MDVTRIDRNFLAGSRIDRTDIRWVNVLEAPIRLHGLAVTEPGRFWRLPEGLIDSVSPGVAAMARCTAGGRVRFRTDSPFIAFRGWLVNTGSMPHMPLTGSAGTDVFINGRSVTTFRPLNDREGGFEGLADVGEGMKDVEMNLPLYNGITDAWVGLHRCAVLEAPRPYGVEKPLVFYGSSITQGGCASKPGNSYPAFLGRWLDADHVNLGFSGSARGEAAMAHYVAGLEMSAFILDYDHNAPDTAHLLATHEQFYRIIRQAQPGLPMVMVSKPDGDGDPRQRAERREIIRATYEHARAAGDERVWFIDGETFFGERDRDACTMDGTHPNDLGFYRMAEGFLPVLREALTQLP